MFQVRIPAPSDPDLYVECEGVQEHDGYWLLFFLSQEQARQWGEPEPVAEENWSAAWQAGWRPSEVGSRFFLTPPGYSGEVPVHRLRLEMIPGNVFGGGDHPTTQLCLELLETLRFTRVADIGAGTGILTRAVRLVGACGVGCDIDPASGPFVDFLGSADALRSGTFDLVIANIHLSVLRELRGELLRILRNDGHLLLSGFLPGQALEVAALFGPPVEMRCKGGWCAGVYRPAAERSGHLFDVIRV